MGATDQPNSCAPNFGLWASLKLRRNGSVVQIDEAFIESKRKWSRGYHRRITECIFGMIDVTTKQSVLRLVPNIKTETLVPIIKEYCVQNAEIHSDKAAMYHDLESEGFIHRTVCHQDNFVAPNGTHTNNIESYWGHLKNHFRRMNGTNRKMLPLHIDEYMYRHNNKLNGDLYQILIRDIARFHPVESDIYVENKIKASNNTKLIYIYFHQLFQ